jgi:epoxyqueuosine reductase QueG
LRGRGAWQDFAVRVGEDYHRLIGSRLRNCAADDHGACPESTWYVDTGPVWRKYKHSCPGSAGGKHTNVISREFGSWIFWERSSPLIAPGSAH